MSGDLLDADLVERAATLLRVLPAPQPRETIEHLLSAHDSFRARRAVDALLEASLATEDAAGRLRFAHGPPARRT